MTWAYYASVVVSATLFLSYGIACLFFEGMRRDFERFGLSRLRALVGTLEVLGALGLIVGQFWPPLVPFSASGLALMLFVGVAPRIRVLDSLAQTLPAPVPMCVNCSSPGTRFECLRRRAAAPLRAHACPLSTRRRAGTSTTSLLGARAGRIARTHGGRT